MIVPGSPALAVDGRMKGSVKSGNVSLQTYNVGKLTLFLNATMLGKKGKLRATINRVKAVDEKIVPDAGVLLDAFERTLDKTVETIAIVQIDVEQAMTRE